MGQSSMTRQEIDFWLGDLHLSSNCHEIWRDWTLTPRGYSSLNFSATGSRVPVFTQVWILLHYGTRLRMLKNLLCTLPPALPPPSFLLSIGSAKLVKQTNNPPPNPTFMILWRGVGSSPFGNVISHVHAGLRTHFDQEPETMQMPHHFRLKLNRIRTKPESF